MSDGTRHEPAPVVQFSGFTKQYGDRTVVEDLTFDVHPGTVVGLLGPNGAGKSSALRGLVGLLRPTSGTATLFGRRFEDIHAPARHVGVHMDGVGFETGITGRRHLEICALSAGMPKTRVDTVLDEVGLTQAGGKRVGKYSTGMRQRLGLATALIGEPELLVLDEPANGLDPEGIRWLRRLLRRHAEAGGSVLLSNHQLAEIAQTVDELVVIRRRSLFAGPLDGLTKSGTHDLEESYFGLLEDAHA
ncbi:ATP-binding cassette domain-containing protein [Streptomyces sp. TM32]|uniref:ATP-binding cassette domain-containing protein n=1 Tax=Streptomyces sp. TM32 TaxID=1652669 RepID=UPI0020B15866|nr:ATP-binding cassette domain-containing protein [Streptomyces sp. TM32]